MASRMSVLAALLLSATASRAGDFSPLMDVARATWPTRTHIAVVGDYAASLGEIEDLAAAAGPGALITVLDTCASRQPLGTPRIIINRIKPDFVVLLRHDPVFREGTPESTWVVRQLAQAGIPSVGSTGTAIGQGAVFAVSGDTGGELLVTPTLHGTIHVVLPTRETLRVSLAVRVPGAGSAAIQRVDLGRGASR